MIIFFLYLYFAFTFVKQKIRLHCFFNFLFLFRVLFCVSSGGISNPFSSFPRTNSCFHALFVTRAMSFYYLPKLLPIDFTKVIVSTLFVPRSAEHTSELQSRGHL